MLGRAATRKPAVAAPFVSLGTSALFRVNIGELIAMQTLGGGFPGGVAVVLGAFPRLPQHVGNFMGIEVLRVFVGLDGLN